MKNIENNPMIEDIIAQFGVENILDNISEEEIINYVDGYMLGFNNNTDTLSRIKGICRELQPHGYIGKEDAKKIICDYIDYWFI